VLTGHCVPPVTNTVSARVTQQPTPVHYAYGTSL
jgi:hypothetical protein